MKALIHTARIQHRGENRIALYFEQVPHLIAQVRKIPGRRWSSTLRCWHVPDTEESVFLIDQINHSERQAEQGVDTVLRLYFFLPQHSIGLRNRIKVIEGRLWHRDVLRWSVPDNPENRKGLKELEIAFEIRKEPADIPLQSTSTKKVIPKKPDEKAQEKSIDPETMEKIDAFERWMEQKRYSRNTIKSYTSFVKSFFVENSQKSFQEFSDTDIIEYNHQKFIKGNQSYSTHNQFINAIKLFFSYHKILRIDPEQIERPRKQLSLPNVLSKEEVGRLLLAVANQKHKCLLAFVYGAGLRIGEVINLEIKDIRVEEKLLYIRKGKGGKDRRVPLSEKMITLFRCYQGGYRPQVYAFEGQKGGKYTTSSAAKIFKRALTDSGIKTEATLHTLRHSYATHLMESGVGLRYIQEVLGHNSPKTTMIYTHISGRRLSEIKSPLDDLEI